MFRLLSLKDDDYIDKGHTQPYFYTQKYYRFLGYSGEISYSFVDLYNSYGSPYKEVWNSSMHHFEDTKLLFILPYENKHDQAISVKE